MKTNFFSRFEMRIAVFPLLMLMFLTACGGVGEEKAESSDIPYGMETTFSSFSKATYSPAPPIGTYTSGQTISAAIYDLYDGSPGRVRFVMKKISGTLIGGYAQIREGSTSGTVLKEWSYSAGSSTISPYYYFPSTFTSGYKDYYITGKNNESWIYSGRIRIYATTPDTTKPTSDITGIAGSYTIGNTVNYTAKGWDETNLSMLHVTVKDSGGTVMHDKIWNVSGTYSSQSSSFSTSSWNSGTYHYALWVKDAAGNATPDEGSFTLNTPADTTKPTGQISGINSSYSVGSTVNYTVYAWDNKSLDKMTFTVTNSSGSTMHNRSWYLAGTSGSESYSFSTSGWSTGTYHYALWVKDSWGNTQDYAGSFVLSTPSDTTKPTGQITGVGTSYTVGDNFSYTIYGWDDRALKKMRFTVKNSSDATMNDHEWNFTTESSAVKSYSFSMAGWTAGTYYYALWVADQADNAQVYTGSFVLNPALLQKTMLKSPTNAATNIQRPVLLEWDAVPDATAYRIFISESESTVAGLADNAITCSGCIDNGNIVPTTNQQLMASDKLKAYTTYYWRVHAGNSVTKAGGPNSDVWWFRTMTDALPAPVLQSPANGSSVPHTSVTLDWNDVAGANVYRVFVSENKSVLDALKDSDKVCSGCFNNGDIVVSASEYPISSSMLVAGKTYHWRVHAGNTITQAGSPKSVVWSFVAKPITNIQPSSGTFEIGKKVNVTWSYNAKPSTNKMIISIKRQYCKQNGADICTNGDSNWRQLASDELNDGLAELTIPEGIQTANDWEFFVKDQADQNIWSQAGSTITIVASSDTQKPTGKVIGFNSSYIIGNKFQVTITAQDNKALDVVTLNISEAGKGVPVHQFRFTNLSGTNFSKTVEIDTNLPTSTGVAWGVGIYHYALWVKDKASAAIEIQGSDGSGNFELKDRVVAQRCIGHNYEQQMPVANVLLPTVAVTGGTSVNEEETLDLTANGTVDTTNGGKAFYYWCVDKGGFKQSSNNADYRTVIYVAPLVSGADETAKITIQVGDGLGYIATKSHSIKITETNNHDSADPEPVVTIVTPTGTLKTGQTVPISFSVTDRDSTGNDTTYLLNTGLYYIVGGKEYPIIEGLRGGQNQYRWTPAVGGSDYKLKVASTDGNADPVSATTSMFTVIQAYRVFGYVVDGIGNPIVNAAVSASGKSIATDYAGYYEIYDVGSGNIMVSVSKAGVTFDSPSKTATLTASEPAAKVNFNEHVVIDTIAPTISDIGDKLVKDGSTTGNIPFQIADDVTASENLILSADSSDEDIVAASKITFGGSASNRTVHVIPEAGHLGKSMVTITVKDQSGNYASDSFLLYHVGTKSDTDGDGLNDLVEIYSGLDPMKSDTDGDGVDDNEDLFPLDPFESKDSDGDGIGDSADTDSDNDDVANAVDNCSLVQNADQSDANHDGIGDACDDDDDNDGVKDAVDMCPLVSDTSQVDTDGDGIGDACDPEPTNPDNTKKQAGDIDGDGYVDIAVAGDNSLSQGAVYVYSGRGGNGIFSATDDRVLIAKIIGRGVEGTLGYSISTNGDFNGDGYYDIAIGEIGGNTQHGAVYILSGDSLSRLNAAGKTIYVDDPTILLSKIKGESLGDNFGKSLAAVRDLNGDNKDELAVGAYFADKNGEDGWGKMYLFSGNRLNGDLVASSATSMAMITGENSVDMFGFYVSSGGDVDGDGKVDIAVSSIGDSLRGATYIYSGSRLAALGTNNSIGAGDSQIMLAKVIGKNARDRFGRYPQISGDVDGDGLADLVTGAEYAGGLGEVYVIDNTKLMGTISASDATTVITGEKAGDRFGASLSVGADADGDKLPDILVGASMADQSPLQNNGKTYLFLSKSLVSGIKPASSADVIVTGAESDDNLGYRVFLSPDTDGDTFADMIIHAYSTKRNDQNDVGSIYWLSTKTLNGSYSVNTAGIQVFGDLAGSRLGWEMSQ